jgi:hypothetical protein
VRHQRFELLRGRQAAIDGEELVDEHMSMLSNYRSRLAVGAIVCGQALFCG